MTRVRTFYWDAKATQPQTLLQRRRWTTGNAGDLLNPLLIEQLYDAEAENVSTGGRRVLFVGTVAHRAQAGDLVCGIGVRDAPIPPPADAPCVVRGTRGPITTEAFRAAGHDLGEQRFEFDPGLLIRRFMPSVPDATPNNVIFIPHYRDKTLLHKPLNLKLDVVNIDLGVLALADRVARAEFVYASSLHGLIFAHALGRPAQLVAPRSAETLLKYQDYYASIGLPWRKPDDILRAIRAPKPTSPVDLPASLADVELPGRDEVEALGLVS